MDRFEIRSTGFGGQGIILSGYIIGKAATVFEGRNATLTQAYGPEARGSACRADVVISDDPIDFPQVLVPSLLIAMSQEGYTKFHEGIAEGGTILIDEGLVRPEKTEKGARLLAIPAQQFAAELGRKVVANMVMLGFMAGTTDVLSAEAMEQAVVSSVPKGTESLNLQAFRKGLEHGRDLVGQKTETAKT